MPYIGKKPADIIATAVDTTTGTFSGAVSAASVDADGGVTVDNITIDGTEIDLSSGNLTIDVAGQLIINSDSGQVVLQDDTVNWGNLQNSSGDFIIGSLGADKDIKIQGLDGSSTIDALTFDMSDAGSASFNSGISASGELDISSSSSLSTISATATGSANLVMGTNFSGSASQGMANQCGFINMRQSFPIVFGTAETERMRIFSDGTISVGSSNSTGGDQFKINNNQSSGFCLNVNNVNATDRLIITAQSGTGTVFHHQFNNSNGSVGTISTNGSTTSYNTSSDYRLKENVTYDFDATTRLKQLKPCRFNFKADKDKTVDGFIAHEVTAVPEAIIGEKDATEKYIDDNGDEQTRIVPQGIDQAKLVPLLTKALQEQQAIIESLTARITALESA